MSVSVIAPHLPGPDGPPIRGLLDSLQSQTVAPMEVLVCLDGPGDESVAELMEYATRPGLPFRFRAFHRTAPRTLTGGGPGLAEQILFANVSGDIIIHVDADGWVDTRLVEFVEAQCLDDRGVALWGQNVFHDPETGAKLSHRDPRLESYPAAPGIYPMPKHPLHAHGALFAVPKKIIRDLGGHNLEGIEYRGNDSRLGERIQAVCGCHFVTNHPFQFHHRGLPTQYSLLHHQSVNGSQSQDDRYEAAQAVKKFRATHQMPQLLNSPQVLIANGGVAFWSSKVLDSMYREIL